MHMKSFTHDEWCMKLLRRRIKGPAAPRDGGILCRLVGSFQSKHFWINNHFPFWHMILILSSCCEEKKKKQKGKCHRENGQMASDWSGLQYVCHGQTLIFMREVTKKTTFHETKHLHKLQQQPISHPTWHILVRWTHDRWPACLSPGTWWRISSCPVLASGLNSSCQSVCLWQVNANSYWASGYKKTHLEIFTCDSSFVFQRRLETFCHALPWDCSFFECWIYSYMF